ncbi:MAG: hypothetical protein IPL32_14605 [Chloracidobacterium sp.]|nr:hypothetical protein [Chloracidobacterium sp.]
MEDLDYKLLATNGKWTKEFLYFVQVAQGDIYYGLIGNHGAEGKTSRHKSGISHIKYKDSMTKLGKGRRLTDYEGLHQLFAMSIGRQVFSSPPFGKPAKEKCIKGSVTIDVRRYKQRVGIMAFLLEPAKAMHLDKLPDQLKNVQFTIMTQTKPWFVLAIYDAGTAVLKATESTMLPWEKTLLKVEIPSSEKGGKLILIDGPSVEN